MEWFSMCHRRSMSNTCFALRFSIPLNTITYLLCHLSYLCYQHRLFEILTLQYRTTSSLFFTEIQDDEQA